MTHVPYWRLSGFYFFYFATVGTLIPYWGLYLESLSFSPAQIGELMALLVGGKIISPYLWGWIADHKGNRLAVIRFACTISVITFIGALYATSYSSLAIIMLVFGFFWSASLPQFEVLTLNHLGENSHAYTRIRLWGSIGFILTVVALGIVLEKFGVMPLPFIVLAAVLGIWLTSLWAPTDILRDQINDHRPMMCVLKQTTVIAMLLVFFLMQLSHGAYYSFYSIYLESYDYSRTIIGQLWALGVIAEVILFLLMLKLHKRFSLRKLLIISLICATIRWMLIAFFPEQMSIIIFAQLLHAATFGIYHAVAIALVHQYFKGQNQGRGQAIYSSLSFGVGGALGSLLSGYIWEGFGPTEAFIFAGAISFLAAAVAWRWVQPEAKKAYS